MTSIVVGAGFILCALLSGLNRWRIYSKGIKVKATVVRIEKDMGNEGGTIDSPVFQYFVDEKSYQTKYSSGNSSHIFLTGEKVHLYYSKKNPSQIMLPSDTTRTVLEIIFFIAGLLLIIFQPDIPIGGSN